MKHVLKFQEQIKFDKKKMQICPVKWLSEINEREIALEWPSIFQFSQFIYD